MNYQKQLEKPNRQFDFRLKIRALAFLFLLSFFILFLKLFYLQILQHKLYYNYAEDQFEKKLILNANRGIIYDRNKNILVKNILGYSLFLSPAFFQESNRYKKNLLQFLSHFLKIDKNDLKRIIKKRQGKNPFMPLLIKKNLSKEEYVYLMTHQSYIRGILVKAFSKRFYPLNENLAHLLGYVGTINSKDWEEKQIFYSDSNEKNPYRLKNTILGQDGIEKVYDLKLRGKDGLAQSLVTAEGRFIEGSLKIIKNSNPGKNLVLTIDLDLQEFISELMKGKKGVVIVSLASTGELLAFFTNPSFNPNLIWKDSELSEIQKDPKKSFYHRALYGRYSPGSIFKIIAAIAAIEEAGINPRRKKFFCKGSVLLGNRYFKCYNSKKHGLLNMYEALKKSCNVYFYKLAGEMGWNPIYKWARKFGLGDGHTLKELDFKSEGLMPDENWKKMNTKVKTWLPGDTYNHVIGQGYTLLYPLEIHNIMSIIVNKGILYQPFLLKELYLENDILESKGKEILKRIFLKRQTMDFLKESLQSVITDGTAYWGTRFIKVPIMGKTGTSQAVLNNEEISNAMFTAYGPIDDFEKNSNSTKLLKDEKIIVTVIVEKTEESSSTVAVPITSAIFKWYFEKKDRKSIKHSLSYFKSFSNSNFLEEEILDVSLKNGQYQRLLDTNIKSLEKDILLFQSNLKDSLKDFYTTKTFTKQKIVESKKAEPKKKIIESKKAEPKQKIIESKKAEPKQKIVESKKAEPKKKIIESKKAEPKQKIIESKKAEPKQKIVESKKAEPKKKIIESKKAEPKKKIIESKKAEPKKKIIESKKAEPKKKIVESKKAEPKQKIVESKKAEPKQKVEESKQKVEEPKQKVEESKQKVEEPKQKVEEPKQKIEEPKQKVEEPKQKVEEPKQKVEEPKQKVEEPKQKVEEPKQKVEEPKQKIEEPKQKVEEPKQKVEEPKQKIEESKQKVEESKQKVEEPKKAVEEPKQKIEEPKQKVEEPKKAVEEKKSNANTSPNSSESSQTLEKALNQESNIKY